MMNIREVVRQRMDDNTHRMNVALWDRAYGRGRDKGLSHVDAIAHADECGEQSMMRIDYIRKLARQRKEFGFSELCM